MRPGPDSTPAWSHLSNIILHLIAPNRLEPPKLKPQCRTQTQPTPTSKPDNTIDQRIHKQHLQTYKHQVKKTKQTSNRAVPSSLVCSTSWGSRSTHQLGIRSQSECVTIRTFVQERSITVFVYLILVSSTSKLRHEHSTINMSCMCSHTHTHVSLRAAV